MFRFMLAGIAASIALNGVAAAQAISRPTELVPSVAFEDITPVLAELGWQTNVRAVNGQQLMEVRTPNAILVFRRRACTSEASCAGLWMFAFMDDQESLGVINEFNQSSKPARATIVNNKVVLDRYLIADYGITRGSLMVNVVTFASMVDVWRNFTRQRGAVAVSFEPLLGGGLPRTVGRSHDERDFLELVVGDPSLLNAPSDHRINLRAR
jgi:hypothetical protein